MIVRRLLLTIAKYLTIFLCLITVLLTTPWGSQLTIALLNNIDRVSVEYRSGSLVRDIELNYFTLQLDNIDIDIKAFSTELDLFCAWKKTLCIKSLNADYFSLRYGSKEEAVVKPQNKADKSMLVMPFAIKANAVNIKESHLAINDTEISMHHLLVGLKINKSQFTLLKPSATLLEVLLEDSNTDKASNKSTATTPTINQDKTTEIASFLANLPQMNLPLSLIIQQLSINEISIKPKNCKESSCQNWLSLSNKFSGSWVNTDVTIRQFQTSTAAFSVNKLEATAKLIPPYQINTRFENELNEVQWWPEIANSTQQVTLQGSLEKLAFTIISQGSLVLNSQGNINLLTEYMPFTIALAAQEVPMPQSLAHYGEPSSITLALSGDVNKQVFALTSELNSYGYNKAQLTVAANHQHGLFNIKELLFKDNSTASQLNLHGDLALVAEDISWRLSAQSTGFSLPQVPLQALTNLAQNQAQVDTMNDTFPESLSGRLQGEITSTGTWSPQQWDVAISNTNISGDLNKAKLMVKGDLGVSHTGKFTPGELFVAFNDSELTLQANDRAYWDIQGQLFVGNLNRWHQELHGAVTSKFTITGKQQNPIVTLNSQAAKLSWQQWQGNDLEIQSRYQPMKNHEIEFSANNQRLTWVNNDKIFTLDDFTFTVKGNAYKHQITTQWLGDLTGKLALEGHWNEKFTHWQSVVQSSVFSYQKTTLKNDKSFAINVDLAKELVIVESHCWLGEGMGACLPNQAVIGRDGDVAVNINLDLSVIDELFLQKDIELISQLQGEIKAKWSVTAPISAHADFLLSPGFVKFNDDFNEYQLTQWSKGEFAFALDAQKFTSTLQMVDPKNAKLMDIQSLIKLSDDYPVDAKIKLNHLDLRPFRVILGEIVDLQGSVSADVTVKGTLASPLLEGGITLDKGKLRLSKNANTFNNISTQVDIANNQATLLGNFFIEGKPANFSGSMAWQDRFTLNVDLNAESLPLIFPPQLTMSVSPRLNFLLNEKALIISGNIDVLDGIYNAETLPEGSVSMSDDVVIVNQHGQVIVKKSSSFDIKTNIDVNIAKSFKVSGQGLQSYLSGKLHISQQEKQPFQLFGSIQSYDGTYKAYGQKLKIEKGELTFNGPIDNPYFNLRASRFIKKEDITVGIQVTGLVDTLTMQLFSSPLMERPAMLSYLVRGRGLDANSDNNAAIVSLLVGYGASNSTALLEQLDKIPLISNITLDTEGDGDQTQVTVSGNVGERIYLKYGRGVVEPINELTVRMYLLNRFWLEIVSGIEQSTDIYYSFDID